MRAYRHLFHAGNFADVFKHALLARLLTGMTRKDKPLLCLDVHAGLGRYDLTHEWARKNEEFSNGIARLWHAQGLPPAAAALLEPYLGVVRAENPHGELRCYPGSPRLMRALMRNTDRLVLTEYNADDCAVLGELFAGDARTQVRCADGHASLKALLPPLERRGLILLDSSFDRPREFETLIAVLREAHRRFATGVYALWYPLMEPAAMRVFERGVESCGVPRVLQLEISVLREGSPAGMRGCGLLVVNPVFGFEAEARVLLDALAPVLAREPRVAQPWRVRWLVPE